jgi:TolB-like protein
LVVSRGTDGSNPASSSGESPANLSRSTSALNADKPSIAVLPFQNMSGDLEQEFFSDGINEDITTALSKLRWFFVIARNSRFIHKGRAVDVKQGTQHLRGFGCRFGPTFPLAGNHEEAI